MTIPRWHYMLLGLCFFGIPGAISQSEHSGSDLTVLMRQATDQIAADPEGALVTLRQAIVLASSSDQEENLPSIYNHMLRVFVSRSMLDSAIHYGRTGFRIAEEKYPDRIAFSARFLGDAFNRAGKPDSALAYLLLAENTPLPPGNRSSIHHYVLQDIASVYRNLFDYEKLRVYRDKSREALKVDVDLGKIDRIVLLNELLGLDLLLRDTVQFSIGLDELQELVQPFASGVEMPEYHVSMFQFTSRNRDEWIEQMRGTLSVHREIGRWENLALTYYLLGHAMNQRGDQLESVLAMVDSSLFNARRHGFHAAVLPALKLRRDVAAGQGDFRTAYNTSLALQHVQDSMHSLEVRKNLEEIRLQYDTEKKERQILEQEIALRNSQRQRNVLFLILGAIALLAIPFEMLRRVRRKNRDLAQQQLLVEKDKTVAESRLQLMRAQMNPHFLFNSLNSIKHYILQKPKDDSAKYVSDFSRLMRLNLQNSVEVLIPLEREVAFLKQYLHMEQMRFSEPFEVQWQIDEALDLDHFLFPPMLIQPYLENAIWHGLRYREGKGVIEIRMYETDDIGVVCIVQDNGVGRVRAGEIQAGTTTLKKSMGTQLTKDRVATINALLKSDITTLTEDLYNEAGRATGTRVTIRVPNIAETV